MGMLQEPLVGLPENVELELALLLREYQLIFNKPVGLPPTRAHDHHISLVELMLNLCSYISH